MSDFQEIMHPYLNRAYWDGLMLGDTPRPETDGTDDYISGVLTMARHFQQARVTRDILMQFSQGLRADLPAVEYRRGDVLDANEFAPGSVLRVRLELFTALGEIDWDKFAESVYDDSQFEPPDRTTDNSGAVQGIDKSGNRENWFPSYMPDEYADAAVLSDTDANPYGYAAAGLRYGTEKKYLVVARLGGRGMFYYPRSTQVWLSNDGGWPTAASIRTLKTVTMAPFAEKLPVDEVVGQCRPDENGPTDRYNRLLRIPGARLCLEGAFERQEKPSFLGRLGMSAAGQ